MFLPGILLLLLPSMLHAYFLMPFPGSQDMETMTAAYYLEKFLIPSRIIGFLLIILPVLNIYLNGRWRGRIGVTVLLLFMGGLFYMSVIMASAERMFLEPQNKVFAAATTNKVSLDKLVVGVDIGGETKAYPINFIAYHHKVQDTIGGKPVLVTYCSMCRTAHVYDPVIDGKYQHFRLVGARHYSAIIEDEGTGSWWYQASGEAGAGPMKGKTLADFPSEQMTLREWIELHPNTLIMQPDTNFADRYANLEAYERRQTTKTDAESAILGWQKGAWVLGVTIGNETKAYRWNDIAPIHVINDKIGTTPLLITVGNDSLSYASWKRTVDGETLHFTADSLGKGFRDDCNCFWNFGGECIDGKYKGKKLEHIQASQEYWHSWKHFHPQTTQWKS